MLCCRQCPACCPETSEPTVQAQLHSSCQQLAVPSLLCPGAVLKFRFGYDDQAVIRMELVRLACLGRQTHAPILHASPHAVSRQRLPQAAAAAGCSAQGTPQPYCQVRDFMVPAVHLSRCGHFTCVMKPMATSPWHLSSSATCANTRCTSQHFHASIQAMNSSSEELSGLRA